MNILEEHREPSFAERFGQALAGMGRTAGTAIPEFMQQVESKKQQAAEMADINKLLGLPGGSIRNPDILKEMVKQKMKAQSLQDQYAMIFGKGTPGSGIINQQSGIGEEGQGIPSQGAEDFTDEQIQAVSLINPNLARVMQSQNEANEKTFDKAGGYQEKVLSDYEAYRRDDAILSQMANIAKKGKLPNPLLVQALDSLGIPLGVLNNPDSEQFQKLSQELVKNISGTYGNRILKVEVDNFLKSIPTLMNSDEGKKRLIEQWDIINKGKKVKYDAYREMIKKYPKRLPRDFQFQVQDKADEKLDKLAEQFKSVGMERRNKVSKGTPLTTDVIDRYLKLANDDDEMAAEMAREDGYEF